MLAAKLLGSGLTSLSLAAIFDVATGLTATGTTQGTALAITNAVNSFSTVGAGSGAVLLSTATKGDSQLVYNGGANPLKVYPDSGSSINGLSANASATVGVRTACLFTRLSTTQWCAVLSA